MIPETITRRYFKIGEVATRLCVPTSTVRFWSDTFSVNPHRTKGGKNRLFTAADLEKLSRIKALTQIKKSYSLAHLKNLV